MRKRYFRRNPDEQLRALGHRVLLGDIEAVDRLLEQAEHRGSSEALQELANAAEALSRRDSTSLMAYQTNPYQHSDEDFQKMYESTQLTKTIINRIYYRGYNSAIKFWGLDNPWTPQVLGALNSMDRQLNAAFVIFRDIYYAQNPTLALIAQASCLADTSNRDALLRALNVGRLKHIRPDVHGRYTVGQQTFIVDPSSGGSHRLKVVCPACGKPYPIGRIGQHGATHFPQWMHPSRAEIVNNMDLPPDSCRNLLS